MLTPSCIGQLSPRRIRFFNKRLEEDLPVSIVQRIFPRCVNSERRKIVWLYLNDFYSILYADLYLLRWLSWFIFQFDATERKSCECCRSVKFKRARVCQREGKKIRLPYKRHFTRDKHSKLTFDRKNRRRRLEDIEFLAVLKFNQTIKSENFHFRTFDSSVICAFGTPNSIT